MSQPVPLDYQLGAEAGLVAGRIYRGLCQTLKLHELIAEDLWLRPLAEFCDMTTPHLPTSKSINLKERIRLNISYYAANYLAMVVLSYMVAGIFYDTRFGVLICATLRSTLYLAYVCTTPLYILETRISKDVALFVGLALLLYYKSELLLRATAIPLLFIALHSICRSPTVTQQPTLIQEAKSTWKFMKYLSSDEGKKAVQYMKQREGKVQCG